MELVLPLLEEVSHCSSHTNANEIPVTFQRQKVHNHQSHDSYYYQYSTKHLWSPCDKGILDKSTAEYK